MDEIQKLLIQSLAFLEMGFDKQHQSLDDVERHADLMWAVHEHIQRAWGLYARHDEPHKISDETNILVSTWHTINAISNAAQKDD